MLAKKATGSTGSERSDTKSGAVSGQENSASWKGTAATASGIVLTHRELGCLQLRKLFWTVVAYFNYKN